MKINFYKYHGAGNDFILLDDRENKYNMFSYQQIAFLCHRRFGIGADGLMLLQNHPDYDFKMIYYNSDGHEGSMCGNGGRCIVSFANKLRMISEKTTFLASDGAHEAYLEKDGIIKLRMSDVFNIEKAEDYFFLNTGSPHYVTFRKNVLSEDILTEGRKIRYNERFSKEGTNVNFVEKKSDHIFVCTYERGVEEETLSCGTGVVASALAAIKNKTPGFYQINAKTKGGNLSVYCTKVSDTVFNNIWLEGPAAFVFDGVITL
ncbi:MAG: diaminopimelate epimerase [Bacteroidetes bacterium RIFOXYA12_FULL_35_11]|nr:MAG: diaminopimelate epimerase [Bacteroidetes bacterium GWF2_35_48]OFY79691.1 MAG: diaminopimelate epimerase [Bacteroidetes bacterium RIFOXYA12_FULL_35_11]OFY95902.1 MAG: diaminopimelate epimerase [Bacteroidetes bacterium RIFOXYB2_FULL_35_7]HBX53177.1 diaminopimelate epimerase [Bacteroidales bacterium]